MKHVCYFRHALALDERRVKFLPEYAYGGASQSADDAKRNPHHTKEVWFAGTHSDVLVPLFFGVVYRALMRLFDQRRWECRKSES